MVHRDTHSVEYGRQRDGFYQLWMDNCGANGLGCTGTPTLRASYNNVIWRGADRPQDIGTLFVDWWANNDTGTGGSRGNLLIDQLKVSTGPIGFMGGSGPPPTAGVAPASPIAVIVR